MPAVPEQPSPGDLEPEASRPHPRLGPGEHGRGEWHGCRGLPEEGVDVVPSVTQRRGVKRVADREGVHHQLLLSHKNSGPENLDEENAETPTKRLKAVTDAEEYNIGTEHSHHPQDGHEGLYDHHVTDVGELEQHNPSSGEEPPLQPVEDIQTCMRSITSETRELLNEWQEPFSESVAYETFCPVRVDEHLRQACALEESLIEQKERLKMRLKMISRTLKTL